MCYSGSVMSRRRVFEVSLYLSCQVQSPTQELLILFFQCIFLCYCCLDVPLKMINQMNHIHTLQEKKRWGVFFPSVGRNIILKVCSLKVFGCLAKILSRMQRNSVLSCSINVNVGGRQLLGSRYTVLDNGYIVKERIQAYYAEVFFFTFLYPFLQAFQFVVVWLEVKIAQCSRYWMSKNAQSDVAALSLLTLIKTTPSLHDLARKLGKFLYFIGKKRINPYVLEEPCLLCISVFLDKNFLFYVSFTLTFSAPSPSALPASLTGSSGGHYWWACLPMSFKGKSLQQFVLLRLFQVCVLFSSSLVIGQRQRKLGQWWGSLSISMLLSCLSVPSH